MGVFSYQSPPSSGMPLPRPLSQPPLILLPHFAAPLRIRAFLLRGVTCSCLCSPPLLPRAITCFCAALTCAVPCQTEPGLLRAHPEPTAGAGGGV
eukprot:2748002-Rhodomonas_salina.1